MDTKDKLIEKLKELIKIQRITISYFRRYSGESERISRFMEFIHNSQSEIAALEQQVEEQESISFKEPEYDEQTAKKVTDAFELAKQKSGKKKQESKEQIKEIIRQKINLENANYDVCICSNQVHLVSREYCKKCKNPLKIEIEDEILKSTIEEQESKPENEHDLIFKKDAIIKKQDNFLNYLLKYCGTSQRIRQYKFEINELKNK